MQETKATLRASALLRRESLPTPQAARWSKMIQRRVLEFPAYLLAQSVVLYSPIGKEVRTESIRDHALSSGKKVFYPRAREAGALSFIRVKSVDELRVGHCGILEPIGNSGIQSADGEATIFFVPGIAFDPEGNRLGRGKGWYDRALESAGDGAMITGLAYELQLVERIPSDVWDKRVHYIVTEHRIIHCGESREWGWAS
ncbi:MAG: 5-formyltetrahydrofolate cyclo-ligase [Deltaproteobacteria bacterium]|nr:5-formyltetrahydrofolate cyclo-ligase [Deltaproteobacteria bacterium]